MNSSPQRQSILLASIGTSLGVLTNAVWALAHQAVPVIPDEVVVLMTKDGKESLRLALFEEGVWEEMLSDMRREKFDIDGKLVFGEASIHMIPDSKGNEIDDLRTGEDNLRAADFMLGELRKYTEDNGTELHVSIAALQGHRRTQQAVRQRQGILRSARLRSVWLARIASPACVAVTPRVWARGRGR